METTASSGQDIRIPRRDREDRDQRNERFRLPSRERDDRPQTQTINRGSRPRQRSPIDYDDMDRIPQGGATSTFGERRNITLRNSVPDMGPSPEIGFSLMNETRAKYDDRFIPTREIRFRQPASSPTMPTAHREYLSGPGNQYGFREFYRYPDERESWIGGRNLYSRERERDRERERERDRERQRDRDRAYRSSNISSHFERDSQHDPYDYRDYHRKRYSRDWDYRRAGVPSGPGPGPGYRDEPHDPRYETLLSRGESGESERNGRYFMATRHNHWRQRDRRSSSPSTRSSITNSPPPPSHHRRSTKASTRSLSPQTRSSTGNSRGSSPRRSDLERVVSSKRSLKISIQKRADNSENEDETNQFKEQIEESILHSGTESSNAIILHTTGTAIHDEIDLEENSFKGSGSVHNNTNEKSEGYGSNEKGGWTGWRSIEPGLAAVNEEKEREKKKLKDDTADSETVTDQTADMDLSSGENEEHPSQANLENKLSAYTDEIESMEESDAVDDLEYISKKDNEAAEVSNNNDNDSIYDESINKMNDNHPDTLNGNVDNLLNNENRSLPVIPEVTDLSTSSSQYIVEGSSQLEDYNAIGAEIEKVENEIDHYKSLLDQKRKRMEEKNLARTNRKPKSDKHVNFDFHQEAILIEVEQVESAPTNGQANICNEITANHKIRNGETVFSEYIPPENDKVANGHEEDASSTKPSTMWEIIYLENKEKTEDVPFDSLIRFGSWGQTNEIYKSLTEYPFYQQNILDYNRLRNMLMEDLQNQKANIKQKELALQQEWKIVHYAWKQKFESLQKTKGKTKQDDNDGNSSTSGFAARWPVRTNRGRRRGDVVRSEAEMEEVMKILQDEQRKCQTWANVPAMILDPKERQQAKFINNNRCVSDPESFYDFKNDINIDWTTQEQENFYELFKSFPKKFGKIAEHLKYKSANDCVIYYYRNKTELKLKDLIPKNGRGQRMIALNSKAKKNNHLPSNTQNIAPINSSGSGVINNGKVSENNEGLAAISEIPKEANGIFERPSVETVPLLTEQPDLYKHSDFNEENSEKSDLLMQQLHNEIVLSNVREKSRAQDQSVNNPEPSLQETAEENTSPIVKKTRTSKSRRKKVKDSDQQDESEPVKKRRNISHGLPIIDNDNNNKIPPATPDAQNARASQKQNSVNDDESVDEAVRGFNLMSLDNHDSNTPSSMQQELTSVSKSKGRPRQIEALVERDNEVSSGRSSIVNDDRITSQKKISSYWNKREVSQFEQSLNEFGKDFRKISDVIRSKTEVQVKNYYEKHYEKQNIGNNTDDVEPRPNINDDVQSSKEKQSQTKSNITVNQNLAQTLRGNISIESQRHNAQSQHHISNAQNDETALSFHGPRSVFFTAHTEMDTLNVTESSSVLSKRTTSPQSEAAPKSNSISLLLNPSNDIVNYNWFNESNGDQSEARSNRGNENEVITDSETTNGRITGAVSSDSNIQNAISPISRQVPPHFMTSNSELHLSARSNSHHQTQSLSQQPSSQYAQYAQIRMQQIASIQKRQIEQQQHQRQPQQHYAHMSQLMSNPQNQQASNISQCFRPTGNYLYMHQQQPNQQVHQQVHHQQLHQQSHHQIQQQRITQITAHNITSNSTPTFIVPINNNYIGNRMYRPTSYLLPSGLSGNNNTIVGQQSVNTGHHIATTTGSPSTSQHSTNVSHQNSFTTLQSSDYNTNEMMVGQIRRVGPPFNGTSHLFTQTPQPQLRPHQSQVHYQQVLHRGPINIGHPSSSISSTSTMSELNYNGHHHHLLQTRPSIVMPGSPPGIIQGMQGVVGHEHSHNNFTDSPRPFSGDQQQSSSGQSNSRPSSPVLNLKLEPPS